MPAKSPVEAAPITQFQRIRSARAFDEIAAQIRTELATGRLAVGNRLPSERALSEQFGVSRNTLREALRSLEHAGLIRLQKGAHGGAFISQHSGEAIATGLMDMDHVGSILPAQLTEARIWLEAVVVREACRRATAADIDMLNRNIDEAQEARRQGDFVGRAERHIEFHRMLARLTDNPIMVIVMNGVLDVLTHFVQRIGDYDNSFVLPSRRRFMEHFAAGDADAAVAEMEACLKRLQRSYMSRIQAGEGASTPKAAPRVRRAPPASRR
ncbi:FCD domain-containing protein [Rhodopseudomonas palustris]|uniref:FadR/GntR family transcriptional regulator n=1 Tax=Rhodopseudomonas palustris TaxID=1076 RepID=UPI002ACD2901|nr:FCD domain-containing protein [Rhodopseudomonas palustris]WQH00512.1 FCD domain-containing protein [Rhodopseudomonas palustris]